MKLIHWTDEPSQATLITIDIEWIHAMTPIDLYTKSWCGFCARAKQLLSQRGIAFRDHDVESDPQAYEQMLQRAPGARTVPQVFIGEHHVGGYTELAAMAFSGELERRLTDRAA